MFRKLPYFFAFCFMLACVSSAQAASGKSLKPGNYERPLFYGQLARSYIVHMPPQAGSGKALPVVINLHGGGGNAKGHQSYVHMDPVADREGFIVVYPNGTGTMKSRLLTWNAGTCCGPSAVSKINDVGFVGAVLDDLKANANIDTRRVYATGMSNGAMMAYRLAVEMPNRIAAIAPVAGAMALPGIRPTQPMSVMHIHSIDDPRALYYGGLGPPLLLAQSAVTHTPVEDTLKLWADAGHCAAKPKVIDTRQWALNAVTHTAEELSFAPCANGIEVLHWRLKGPGHVWPGGERGTLPRLLGAGTDVINANVEMWKFFSRHTLPAAKH